MAQCTAHSKRSGARCRLAPIHGSNVCHLHGGSARQVKAKAAVRATLQQLLREMPERPWAEVYREALHVNDVIMRNARGKVESGEALDPAEVDQLQQAAGRAALLARGAHDIGVADRLTQQTEMLSHLTVQVLGATLHDLVYALALDPAYEEQVRGWLHSRVHAELLAAETGERLPALPAPPVPPERAAGVLAKATRTAPAPRSAGTPSNQPSAGSPDGRGHPEAEVRSPFGPPATGDENEVETIPPDPRTRVPPSQDRRAAMGEAARPRVRVVRNPDGSTTTSGGYRDG